MDQRAIVFCYFNDDQVNVITMKAPLSIDLASSARILLLLDIVSFFVLRFMKSEFISAFNTRCFHILGRLQSVQEVREMLKEEILQQAKEHGIALSSSMIERYVEYGLIVSNKDSQGYSKGVFTHYHESTLKAILLIDELKLMKLFKHQKDYIFILFWKGYPIQWDKLKARLLEFHSSVMDSFKVIAGFTANPSYKEIIDDIAADEVNTNKSIGRPSKYTIEAQKKAARETSTRITLMSKLISDIFDKEAISLDVFQDFNRQSNIDSEYFNESVLVHANNWLQMKTWRNAVKKSDEQDYIETYELITILKEYWSDLIPNNGNIYDIPFIGRFVQELEENFQIKIFSDRPWFYRFVILILLSGGFRQVLLMFLADPVVRNGWKQFVAAISLLKENREEVILNG
ncbi:hypothetical protein GC098_14060 [Paenibacillus sp. LMG 31458]|uniref:Uncharacterized protein n=1 Tax=Paenibacillus phytorum TaxID=2654977 RepID=A0ABX1XVF9_9BACL|nr:hypothetical protein [Paenibacillus phytorum]NOU72537.1 hypothetical protein [Paenibacillus phytorum]